MKKVIFGIAVLAIAATVALNVNLGAKKFGEVSLFALANIEALADDENEGETLRRIKLFCTCYNDDNIPTSMSILDCEEYQWYPPMERTTCVKTNCFSGSSCS